MNVRERGLSPWVVNLVMVAAVPAAIGLAAAFRTEGVARLPAAHEDPKHAEHCEVCAWRYRLPGPGDDSGPRPARERRLPTT
jgi:hypothetical protein